MNNSETDIGKQLLDVILNSSLTKLQIVNPDIETREAINRLFKMGLILEINNEITSYGINCTIFIESPTSIKELIQQCRRRGVECF